MIEFNKRFQLTTPAGMISETGISEINQLIAAQRLDQDEWKALNPSITALFLPILPFDWQWVWIVSKGIYAGTMAKRVASYYYKQFSIKSPTSFIEQIGNLARQHTSDGVSYDFDFTNALDWEDGDFGDAGSCYWGDHAAARDMLISDGAFAIRFYSTGDEGIGRAWIVDRIAANGFYVVYNGYGISDSATLTAARVMSLFLSLTYKRVVLRNNDHTSGMLWINGGVGYLVGSIEVIADVTWFDLQIEDMLACHNCGQPLTDDQAYRGPDDENYCDDCFYEYFDTCYECDDYHHREDLTYIEGLDRDVCHWCLTQYYITCAECGEDIHRNDSYEIEDKDGRYCEDCRDRLLAEQATNQTDEESDAPDSTEAS